MSDMITAFTPQSEKNITITDGANPNPNIAVLYEHLNLAKRWLFVVTFYFLSPIGMFGSIMTLIVLRKSCIKSSGFSIYVKNIAIFDGCKIMASLTYAILVEFGLLTTWLCRITYFFAITFALLPNFLVAAVAFEKALAVVLPFKVKAISTPLRAKIIVCLAGLLAIACTAQNLFTWNIGNKGLCVRDFTYAKVMEVSSLAGTILMSVTFIILFVCSIVIIHHLRQHNHRMVNLQANEADHDTAQRRRKDAQISAMLLSICTLYIITNFPVVFLILTDVLLKWINWSLYHTFLFLLIYQAAILLSQINHSMNFYLYLITARFFRDETKAMFTRSCKCCSNTEN